MKKYIISVLLLLVASQLVAETTEPPGPNLALDAAVKQYWQAVAKRDWGTTYAIDLFDASSEDQDQPGEDESSEAKATTEQTKSEAKSPEQIKSDYISRKHKALSAMLSYQVHEVKVDESGVAGTARISLRKPIQSSMGYAHKELTFTEHWVISNKEWRRQGTKGEKIHSAIVPAPGVRSSKTSSGSSRSEVSTAPPSQPETSSPNASEATPVSPDKPAGKVEAQAE